MREARRAFRRVACAMTRASACGSSWLSVESRRVALATIATPSRADAPRRRPVAAVRHATAAEAPATHWAGRQKARAALASATRLMSESDRASFAAYDVEFVVEISRCRAPLHRSTTQAPRPAADVELYSSTALSSALHLYSSTALYTLHPLHPPSARGPPLFTPRGRAPRSTVRVHCCGHCGPLCAEWLMWSDSNATNAGGPCASPDTAWSGTHDVTWMELARARQSFLVDCLPQ